MHGNKFTAFTSRYLPIPSDKTDKPLITGELFLSNGLPSLIKYSYTSNSVDLYLTYSKKVDGQMLLPNLLHAEERHPGVQTNSYTMELLSFRLTNFVVASTALDAIKSNNLTINTLINHGDGKADLVSIRGKNVKPIAVKMKSGSFQHGQDKPRFRHSVILMLICSSLLVLVGLIYLSKKLSK